MCENPECRPQQDTAEYDWESELVEMRIREAARRDHEEARAEALMLVALVRATLITQPTGRALLRKIFPDVEEIQNDGFAHLDHGRPPLF